MARGVVGMERNTRVLEGDGWKDQVGDEDEDGGGRDDGGEAGDEMRQYVV